MSDPYPVEKLADTEDDGTMPDNVQELREAVVGHRITAVEPRGPSATLTLDNGTRVTLAYTSDCCAFTELEAVLLHLDRIDHIITGVGTTGDFTTWHVYADLGDVLELTVGWDPGTPFYYGYGFDIAVVPAEAPAPETCVHCGANVGQPGGFWTHLDTNMSRCASATVPYGHLAHPAGVPCQADGPNPCLGAQS